MFSKRVCVLLASLTFALVCGLGRRAVADSSADDRARALDLFKQSAAHYEAGRYAVAAELLEEAYVLHAEPKLLYNLGRAREANGEIEEAIEAYEEYLKADPRAAQRAELEKRLVSLRERLPPPPEAPERVPGTTPAVAAPDEGSPARHPGDVKAPSPVVPWVFVGSGGALLVTAITVGIIARLEHQKAADEPVQSKALEQQSKAERKALAANVLGGAGAALAVAGGAWLLFGTSRTPSSKVARGRVRGFEVRLEGASVGCVLTY